MWHYIKHLILHTFYLFEQPHVKEVVSDIKVAGGISGGVSAVLAIAIPELAHGLSLLFWGGVCTIAFYFLRRWLKKNYPDHEHRVPKEPDTEDQP